VIMRVTGTSALRGATRPAEAPRDRSVRSRGPLRPVQQARILTQISADARGCTQMERNASQAVDHALDFQASPAEVEQQAELPAGCLEIVDALHPTPGSRARGHVRVIQCFDGLQFDQQHVLDHQVHEVLVDHRAVIHDRGAALLRDSESRLAQRVCQRILGDLLQKSGTSVLSTVNARPTTFPDSSLNLFLSACFACICLYLRKKLLLFAMAPANDCQSVDAPDRFSARIRWPPGSRAQPLSPDRTRPRHRYGVALQLLYRCNAWTEAPTKSAACRQPSGNSSRIAVIRKVSRSRGTLAVRERSIDG